MNVKATLSKALRLIPNDFGNILLANPKLIMLWVDC